MHVSKEHSKTPSHYKTQTHGHTTHTHTYACACMYMLRAIRHEHFCHLGLAEEQLSRPQSFKGDVEFLLLVVSNPDLTNHQHKKGHTYSISTQEETDSHTD